MAFRKNSFLIDMKNMKNFIPNQSETSRKASNRAYEPFLYIKHTDQSIDKFGSKEN